MWGKADVAKPRDSSRSPRTEAETETERALALSHGGLRPQRGDVPCTRILVPL